MKSLLLAVSLVSSLCFAHQHSPWVTEKELNNVVRMSPELLKEIYKNLGGEVEDAELKQKANDVAVSLYEGMKKVPEFARYPQRIPQFEIVAFKGSEKTDHFNAFFFGGRNNLGKCQLVNSLLISEGALKLLNVDELTWMMSHELIHLLKGHKCQRQENRLAFYEGDLLSVLDKPGAAGEVAYLRERFPLLHEAGGLILPGTPAYDRFIEKSRVFTSEIEADEGQVVLLSSLNKPGLETLAESFFRKAAQAHGEKLDCDGVSGDYLAKDYFASFQKYPNSPEGTLHPSLCTRLQHARAEIRAHRR